MSTRTTTVWTGNAGLEPLLVALDELHAHPRNPRRGDVDAIRRSLDRFGQQRPILALTDGTIVAGHHVWQAARRAGWSHVATVRSDLTDEEVEAYLLADNRLADLGLYDDRELAELLSELATTESLDGIGYSRDDLDALLAYLEPARLEQAGRRADPAGQPYAIGDATLFRIQLSYDQERYERLVDALDAIGDKLGVDSYSEVVEAIVLAAVTDVG
jgi:hypothetical protein